MKTSALKNQLRFLALKEMPEVIDRIDLSRIDILPKEEKRNHALLTLRRVLTYSFSFLFLGFLSVGAYSLFIQGTTTLTPLETDEEVLAFQAISASSLLTDISATPLSYNPTPYDFDVTASIDDDIDMINKYLNMMETVLGNQDTMTTQRLTSDLEEYSNYILYRNQDCIGNLIEYKFYYNVITTEEESKIEGILFHEGNSFSIEATYSGDSQNNITSFKASIGEDHYVEVLDMSDNKGQKYRFKYYAFGSLENEATISIKMKNGKLKASIQTKGNSDFLLDIERVNTSSGDHFQVNYTIMKGNESKQGDFQVDIVFDSTNSSYQYKYSIKSNGTQHEMMGNRGNKGSVKADDDDFSPMTDNDTGHHNTTTTTTMNNTTQTSNTQTSNTQPTTTSQTPQMTQTTQTSNTSNTTTSNSGNNPH